MEHDDWQNRTWGYLSDMPEQHIFLDGGTLDFCVFRSVPWKWWQRPRLAYRSFWWVRDLLLGRS